MNAFIDPPQRIPFLVKLGIRVANKVTGKDLLPPKLLAWFPKAAVGSGVLESLIAKEDKDLDGRLLKLIRMQVSLLVSCSFCIDMNSFDYRKSGISDDEAAALQSGSAPYAVPSFSNRDRLALQYATLMTQNTKVFPMDFIDRLKTECSEREIVILATTAAQVNYWARLLHGLGVPPAGFSDSCALPSECLQDKQR